MSPFAQLGELEKSAFLKGFGKLVRKGVWGSAKDKTGRALANYQQTGKAAPAWLRGLHGTSKFMKGKPGKGLALYGLAGIGGDVTGAYNLPGSQLAFNTTMPGLGTLFSMPGLITAARMSSLENQNRLREDVYSGTRAAAGDLMSLANADHRFVTQPGLYQRYMQSQGTAPGMTDHAAYYSTGKYKPLSGWDSAASLFTDSRDLINDRIDRQIFQSLAGPPVPNWLQKSGGLQKQAWLGTAFRGAKKVFPWVFPALGVGAVGHAALRDKPYDEMDAMSRGYAAGQVKLNDRLNNLTGMERLALRLDPTLVAGRLEKHLPGTIGQWEQQNGRKWQPGWLSNMMDRNRKGNPSKFYEYDATGRRHYIQ